MKISCVLFMLGVTIFLGFQLQPVHASDASDISIQNVKVEPSVLKVGDTFTITSTFVNNSTSTIVLDGGACVPVRNDTMSLFTVTLDDHAKIKAQNLTCAGVGLSKMLDPGKSITGTSPNSTVTYVATESGTATITVTFSYHSIIQKDPIQTSAEQNVSKSFQFLIHGYNETSQKQSAYFPAPLQQIRAGSLAQNVKCNVGLNLVIKSEDNSLACVKPDTAQILIERGWAENMVGVSQTNHMMSNYTVEVVSVQPVPSLNNPGGPPIQLTLRNIGAIPITSLKATLALNNDYTFDFKNVTLSNPLLIGDSISETKILIGAGFGTELTYPITISGIADNIPFTFTENIHMP